MLFAGFSKLVSSKGQSRENHIRLYLTHQSISLKGKQRPVQFWNNCNIVYLLCLQNPIRAC